MSNLVENTISQKRGEKAMTKKDKLSCKCKLCETPITQKQYDKYDGCCEFAIRGIKSKLN
jgi:hypothetical protein